MRKYHTPTAPMTFICLSGAQIIAYAIPHGFTHVSHTSTHASHAFYHAYLPRSLSRVPRRHGRDRGIVSAIAAMAWYFSPQGYFVLRFLFFLNCFFFQTVLILYVIQ